MFKSTRIKLTAWYLLIIMIISIAFSTVIYKGLVNEVDRIRRLQTARIERRLHILDYPQDLSPDNLSLPIPNNPDIRVINLDSDLYTEARQRILIILTLINGGIFIVSALLGYFLAGKTLRPIQNMLDEQNRFISDASHEFRTPLTSLKTAMEVSLRDKNFTVKESKKLISESIDEVNKMQSLSDKLLQLAQYEKPHETMTFEDIDLTAIIDKALKKIHPVAKEKHITISATPTRLSVKGNPYSLTDLMVILLDNAVKYSPKNSRVEVSVKRTDGSAIILIKDEGVGIAKKDLPHIFERFYRANTARSKTESGGYGLGLSIAKQIVKLHNGSIHIENNKKKGAICIVMLPVHSAAKHEKNLSDFGTG